MMCMYTKTEMEKSLETVRHMIAYSHAIKTGFRVDKSLDQLMALNGPFGEMFKAANDVDKLKPFVNIMLGMYISTEHAIETILSLDILEDSEEQPAAESSEQHENEFSSVEEIHEKLNSNARWFNYLATELGFVAKLEIWHSADDALNAIKAIDEDLYDLVKILKDRDHIKAIEALGDDLENLSAGFSKIYELNLTTNADIW